MFWDLASASWAGVRLITQEKTKNITKPSRMMAVRLRMASDFGDGMLTVITALSQGEAGDGRAVVEGEHQHRDGQPLGRWRNPWCSAFHSGPHRSSQDQVQGDARQNGDERIDQELGHFQHQLLASQHHGHHGHDEHDGEDPARGGVICNWLTRKLSTVLVMPTP